MISYLEHLANLEKNGRPLYTYEKTNLMNNTENKFAKYLALNLSVLQINSLKFTTESTDQEILDAIEYANDICDISDPKKFEQQIDLALEISSERRAREYLMYFSENKNDDATKKIITDGEIEDILGTRCQFENYHTMYGMGFKPALQQIRKIFPNLVEIECYR